MPWSCSSLLATLSPFAADQIRRAIYPQLAQDGSEAVTLHANLKMVVPEAPVPVATEADEEAEAGGVEAQPEWLRESAPSAYKRKGADRTLQQDPEATVQMGPGVPTWHWRTWQLSWSGSVDKAHEVRVYLISPLQNRLLGVLRVLLLGALLVVLLRRSTPGRDRPGHGPQSSAPPAAHAAAATAVVAALLSAMSALSWAGVARADLPDAQLLEQLRARVTKPAECRPSCASIDEVALDVSSAGLSLTATVHAGERTSVRLPGPAATWVPAEVSLDRGEAAVMLLEDGFLHVRVEPGVHVLQARGPLPETDALTLSFADHPHRARVHAEGYKVDGVRDDGRVEQAIQLSRMLSVDSDKPLEGAALPPFLLLERELELGPSWQTHNRLTRVSPLGTPILVRVPLLAGESVTDSAAEVVGGELQVSFGRDDAVIEWRSRLPTSSTIELSASKNKPWTERWTLRCGPIWHCVDSGLTPTHRVQGGTASPLSLPWPGERVSVAVTRPTPAAGASTAIDAAELEVTPGVRLQNATLTLQLRSSRGASQTVRLPSGHASSR